MGPEERASSAGSPYAFEGEKTAAGGLGENGPCWVAVALSDADMAGFDLHGMGQVRARSSRPCLLGFPLLPPPDWAGCPPPNCRLYSLCHSAGNVVVENALVALV